MGDYPAIERFNALRDELQLLYGGGAAGYDPTAGGYLFPPHGMCAAEVVLKMVSAYQQQVNAADQAIAALESELKQFPYVAYTPHPMIRVQPNAAIGSETEKRRAAETRVGIIRKIAYAAGDRRLAQEGLDFWRSVRAVGDEYMEALKEKFTEKAELQKQLLVQHGVVLPPW